MNESIDSFVDQLTVDVSKLIVDRIRAWGTTDSDVCRSVIGGVACGVTRAYLNRFGVSLNEWKTHLESCVARDLKERRHTWN